MEIRLLLKRLLHCGVPVPRRIRPLIRACYRMGTTLAECLRWLYASAVVVPVVRSIAEVGPQLRVERIPYIYGPGSIRIGGRVYLSGKMNVSFSARGTAPRELSIGDDSFVGHNCSFSIGSRIDIGSHVLLAGGIRIHDNDGHPVDAGRRHAGEPVAPEEVVPVTIEDGAWIGHSCIILKGVTIGHNSVIGAGSVVTCDIPCNVLAAGVPAKVIRSLDTDIDRSLRV